MPICVLVFLLIPVFASSCVVLWSDWTPCSRTCGNGVQVRTMRVASGSGCAVEPPQLQYCNLAQCPVDCKWLWTNWTECAPDPTAAFTRCGSGTSSRDPIVVQMESAGGKVCPSLSHQTIACDFGPPCPKDCVFRRNWTEWTGSCGQARRVSVVEIISPPQDGGQPCPENTVEYRDIPCLQDCKLSEWSPWSVCNATCKGYQTRTRRVMLYPSVGGATCDPRLEDTRMCNAEAECAQSCMGNCGQQLDTCGCDSMCEDLGDCCQDFQRACPAFGNSALSQSSCFKRCGASDGDILGCWCDTECHKTGDCCPDFEPQCPTLARLVTSCAERCGVRSMVTCSCDPACGLRGDCCADVGLTCQGRGSLSCASRCGQFGPLGAAIAAAPLASTPVMNSAYAPGAILHFMTNNQYASFTPNGGGNPFLRASVGSDPYGIPDFGNGRRLMFAEERHAASVAIASKASSRTLLIKSDWTLPVPASCYCDGMCLQHGDCCDDYQSTCLAASDSDKSCKGKCGAVLLSAPCYCDDHCDSNQDCCSDKKSVCDVLPSMLAAVGG